MKRLTIILMFSAVMLAAIVISMRSITASKQAADVHSEQSQIIGSQIPSEAATFAGEGFALEYQKMNIDDSKSRSISNYYKNRAFHGAPPLIPHEVEDERNMGDKSCLKCHQNGGYVKKWDAYTPVVPHPDFINCRQCHVTQNVNGVFQPTNFEKQKAPSIGSNNKALVSSPPVIPHQLQLHENCLSCHAGPGAPKEIRVSHPERINCRQCHVFNNKEVEDIGDFVRTKIAEDEK